MGTTRSWRGRKDPTQGLYPEGAQPCRHLDLTLQPPELGENAFLLFVVFVTAALGQPSDLSGPRPYDLFNLSSLHTGPHSKHSHIGHWGVNIYISGGTETHSTAPAGKGGKSSEPGSQAQQLGVGVNRKPSASEGQPTQGGLKGGWRISRGQSLPLCGRRCGHTAWRTGPSVSRPLPNSGASIVVPGAPSTSHTRFPMACPSRLPRLPLPGGLLPLRER